jgi:mannitol-specific phosphotransferase system IIBC component
MNNNSPFLLNVIISSIFFGRSRYIERANQKVAKNKIHERKTENKRKENHKNKKQTQKEKKKANRYITEKEHQD